MFDLTPYARRNNLTHERAFDPFREMAELEHSFFNTPFFEENMLEQFKTDIKDEGNSYLLEADLPGFDKKDINVDVENGRLVINAERHSEHEEKDKRNKFVRCERSYGSYSRSFDVSSIKEDEISAKYENGVLSVTMPKKEESKPLSKHLEIE